MANRAITPEVNEGEDLGSEEKRWNVTRTKEIQAGNLGSAAFKNEDAFLKAEKETLLAAPSGTIKGRSSPEEGPVENLTAAQVRAIIVDTLNQLVSQSEKDFWASKLDSSLLGAANGVAPLGANVQIPAIYLPSFVDDVIEKPSFAAFPADGELGKIYVDTSTPGGNYRWSGTQYIDITPSPGSTDAIPEGATNLYFTTARVLALMLRWKGPWQEDYPYTALDAVSNAGSSWRALLPSVGVIPSEGLYWTIIAQKGGKGDLGNTGPAATVTVGTVVTGDPGTDATVTNVGTQYNAVLDISIPRGDPGPFDGTTDNLPEGTNNKFFTSARAIGATLAGFNDTAATVALTAEDTVKSGIEKLYAWVKKIFTQIWTEKLIIASPAAGAVMPYSPLTRDSTLSAVTLTPSPGDVPAAATPVALFHCLGGNTSPTLTNSATSATLGVSITLKNKCYMLIDKEVVQITHVGGNALPDSGGSTAYSGTGVTIVRAQLGTTAAAHSSGAAALLCVCSASLSTNSPTIVTSFRDGSTIQGSARDLTTWVVGASGLSSMSVTAVCEWVNRQ